MRKFKIYEKCNHCAKCKWFETGGKNKERRMICTATETNYPECYEKEDWRDNVDVEIYDPNMTKEELRMQVEIENPHIVLVQKEIKRERAMIKRAQDIYDYIMHTGGINGYTLIKRA